MTSTPPLLQARPTETGWPAPVELLAIAGLAAGITMALAGPPPVDLHGPLHYLGIMDPLCGGTRSVRLAFRGQWATAWRYNPAGVPLALTMVLLSLRAALAAATRRHLRQGPIWTPTRRRAAWWLSGVLLVLLEINQQAHAALLSHS